MKKWIAGIASALMILTLAGCSGNTTVANMKGAKITKDEYYDAMKTSSEGGEAVLRDLILDKALESQYGSKVTNKDVNNRLDEMRKQLEKSKTTLESFAAQNQMTMKSLKKRVRTNLLLTAALRDFKKPTKEELDAQWKVYTPKVTVQHILVTDEAKAKDIIKQYQADPTEKKFNQLAKDNSTDVATKDQGGKLEPFDNSDETLNAVFRQAALGLTKTGQITTKPVKTDYGYHVIRAISASPKGKFEDHKKELEDQIYSKWQGDQTIMTDTIRNVLKKANVSIKDKDLKDVLSIYLQSQQPQQPQQPQQQQPQQQQEQQQPQESQSAPAQ